jgi:hypothetical protein
MIGIVIVRIREGTSGMTAGELVSMEIEIGTPSLRIANGNGKDPKAELDKTLRLSGKNTAEPEPRMSISTAIMEREVHRDPLFQHAMHADALSTRGMIAS